MLIELGGGLTPKGEGYVNVDQIPEADIVHNLNEMPWPIESDSVDALYSSHCLEHLDPYAGGLIPIWREICRICKIGATVEIRVPDPMSDFAMCPDHKSVIGPGVINHMTTLAGFYWAMEPKRLCHTATRQIADPEQFRAARNCRALKRYSDADLLRWVPRVAFENQFDFLVVSNERAA